MLVITKRVSVRFIIASFTSNCKRGAHFVERFLHFGCRWRKNTLRLRVALSGFCYAETGCKGRSELRPDKRKSQGGILGLQVVFCSVLIDYHIEL